MRRFSLLIISLLAIFPAFSQQVSMPVASLKFDALTINEGLSQGMVNCILQDNYGFMWFGTKDGLNRYDGYNFIVYRHDAADTSSIADNYITQVFEDSRKRLWIGTAGQGLDLFDREKETFMHIRHLPGNEESLSDDRIIQIREDALGNIWAGTVNGLNKIEVHEDNSRKVSVHIYHTRLDSNNPRNELFKRQPGFALDETFSSNLFADSKGRIWVSTAGRMFRIQPGKGSNNHIEELLTSTYSRYPQPDKGLEVFVQAFLEDTIRGRMYFIMEYSIAILDEQSGALTVTPCPRLNHGIYGHQNSIDRKGNLWLTEYNWIERCTPGMQRTHLQATDPALKIMLDAVNCIYIDRDGNVWAGTKGYGILKHNPRTEYFHHTDHESIGWMSATHNNKIVICKDAYSVDIFNPATAAYEERIPDSLRYTKYLQSDVGILEAAVADCTGVFWMAKGHLIRYDPANKILRNTDPHGQVLFPLYIDHKQALWFGRENSFSTIDATTSLIHDFPYPVKSSKVPYEFLESVCEDSSGNFWLGTVDGLLKFTPADSSWKIFKNKPGVNNSISFNLIFSLCPDPVEPNHYLWIGTNGGGLNRFDMINGTARRYTARDGLPNDVIYGILSDDKHCLWMSTNKGLSCFNLQTLIFRNYNMQNGLQNNEFNRYAYTKTADGTLFFGGVNGFNYFKPGDIEESFQPTPVLITALKIRNTAVNFRKNNSTLVKPVYLTSAIDLPYTDNMVTFEFAAMNFTRSGNNYYQYQLEGFDKTWIQSGNTHFATYTNLDPGEYTFRVRASNNDQQWSNNTRLLQVRILPPWYMTWWFRTILVLSIVLFAWLIYRLRLKNTMAIQDVRNRLARDLHDEIGSNLSSISIFSDVAATRSGNNTEVVQLLGKINEFTQTSMESISDIVWMINPHHEHFSDVISRMRAMAAELFEAKGYELHLDFDEQLNNIRLGMESKRHFYLLYKEALNNTAKYAEGTRLNIRLKYESSSVYMRIEDDGKGFDAATIQYGNGLNNMRERAALLKGKILIEGKPGQGTTIIVQFPVR